MLYHFFTHSNANILNFAMFCSIILSLHVCMCVHEKQAPYLSNWPFHSAFHSGNTGVHETLNLHEDFIQNCLSSSKEDESKLYLDEFFLNLP